jgi:hypothetical protein
MYIIFAGKRLKCTWHLRHPAKWPAPLFSGAEIFYGPCGSAQQKVTPLEIKMFVLGIKATVLVVEY